MQFPRFKLNRQQITATALLLMVFIIPLGIIIPSILEIRSTATAIYNQYTFLEERNRLGYDIKKARRDYDDALPYRTQLESLALPEGSELAFITAIESLADKKNVTVTLNLSLDKATKGKLGQLPFTLRIEGNFVSVMNYIGSLRTLPMTTSFNRVSISKKIVSAKEQRSSVVVDTVAATMEGFVYRTQMIENK